MAVTPAQIQAERLRRANQSPQKSVPAQRVQTKNPDIQKAVFDEKLKREQDRRGTAKPAEQSGGFWRTAINQLGKPLGALSNLTEDTVKSAMYPINQKIYGNQGTFDEYKKSQGIDFTKHQVDVWSGKNKRNFIDIGKDAAELPEIVQNVPLATTLRATTMGGDFLLDPLNKVKILAATQKGNEALKTGRMALSVGEQAKKGQRALLQFGNMNILPSVGNRVLAASTKANDALRATKLGSKAFDALSSVSTSIRPADVSRGDFKALRDAITAGKNVQNYTKDKAIQFAVGLEKSLRDKGAKPEVRSAILHAIEKGDKSLVPQGLDDVFEAGVKFKGENEKAWKAFGGSTLDNYGLAHVATDEVADAASSKALRGFKPFSYDTPQDIHREWVKVDGKIVNLADEGIKYDEKANLFVKNFGKETSDGGFVSKFEPVNVEQATAKEINEAMTKAGKSPIFKEDLPTVVARMGISTGRKQAGVEFLEATKGLEGKAKELAQETYEKMTNVESVAKAIKAFDKVQNLWKAQVLVAPSYHIRNEVGNLWNNFLANVGPDAYVKSTALQKRMTTGALSKADEAVVEQMKKLGVIGTGQYGGDITQSIAEELGGASLAPWKQNFGLYKGNRAVGSAIEDNAKIAHYIQKIGEGFTPKAAAESVKKYLFDYGDLTWGEQNILKRALPFYTWTRKNLPLQVEQFFNKPGKFSNVATLQRDIESGVEKPEERYLNDFIKTNTPMRISTNEDGTTSYLLLGQWLPAAAAVQLLTQNPTQMLNMISPVYKVPKDFINNQSFFKNSLGEDQSIAKYPEEMKSFLGMDMGAKTANILRNIRVLSELDKLNPGGVFGGKDTPSMIPGGSQNRGAKQTPDAPAFARWRDFIVGKTQTYDPKNSKVYYDRDTEDRMGEYTRALDQAMEFKNPEQAKQIIKLMKEFQSERAGGKNKILDQYNLMGDRYLQDRYKDRQAEFDRKDAREKMKELIRKAVETNDANLLQEALRLDPPYAKDAIKDAMKEKQESGYSTDIKKQLYEVERMKTEKRLNHFYTK